MVNRSVSVQLSLWDAAQRKAGLAPISAVIRILLRKWMKGEIEISQEDIQGDTDNQ